MGWDAIKRNDMIRKKKKGKKRKEKKRKEKKRKEKKRKEKKRKSYNRNQKILCDLKGENVKR